jgi:hypothetical protein
MQLDNIVVVRMFLKMKANNKLDRLDLIKTCSKLQWRQISF